MTRHYAASASRRRISRVAPTRFGATASHAASSGSALATGRFPDEELEKFAQGADSLVDAFLGSNDATLDAMDDVVADDVDPDESPTAEAQPLATPGRPSALRARPCDVRHSWDRSLARHS